MGLKEAIYLTIEIENMSIWVENREMSPWMTGNVAGLQSSDNPL